MKNHEGVKIFLFDKAGRRPSTMPNHSLDDCLRLVADHRRRRLLQQLRYSTRNTVAFETLVDRLHDEIASEESHTDRERLALQLHHTHLPTLEDHGVVEYDLKNGAVQYHPDDQIETVLDSLPDEVSMPTA
jgi:hypothetical protein